MQEGDEKFVKRVAIPRNGFGTIDHTCRNRDVSNNNLTFKSQDWKLKDCVEVHGSDSSA